MLSSSLSVITTVLFFAEHFTLFPPEPPWVNVLVGAGMGALTLDVGALVCSIELVEVTTASTEEVDAPSPRVERGRRRRDRGRQRPQSTGTATAINADAEERTTSTQSLYDAATFDYETGEPL